MSNPLPRSTTKRTKSNNLPPPRTSEPFLRPVSPPFSNTRLHRLIYILILLTTILTAYYAYRIAEIKNKTEAGAGARAGVGGWWNLALRRHPSHTHTQVSQDRFRENVEKTWIRSHSRRNDEESVEEMINALAHALGMPSKDLASAIAVAVREYVPSASLSSVAARETGPAVQAMLKGQDGDEVDDNGKEDDILSSQSFGSRVVSGVMDGFVGMDDEPV